MFSLSCDQTSEDDCWLCEIKVLYQNPEYPSLILNEGIWAICDMPEEYVRKFEEEHNIDEPELIQTCKCQLQ